MDYNDIKKYIFKLQPETAHNLLEKSIHFASTYTPFILDRLSKSYIVEDSRLSQDMLGTHFPNPVGLGAGFDKNCTMVEGLRAIGFGYVEIGTVTPKPQSGNPKPRLFRYPKQNSLQNAMGFNNDGMEAVRKRLQKLYPYKIPIGANIGKNKTTPQERAIEDYRVLIEAFREISDYIVINISSPNTPGLRDLQNEAFIKELFKLGSSMTDKPILLKIAPDLEAKDAIELCRIALESGSSGIIATNTTIDYSLLEGSRDFGGISGEVLKEKSFKLFQALAKEFYGKTTLISVGGIDSAEEAYRRIKSGAALVQVLSALIFHGPSLVKEINLGLLELLERDGFSDITQAVGCEL